MFVRGSLCVLFVAGLLGAPRVSAAEIEAEGLFATRVLPLLKARCGACHGDDPQDLQGGLDLSSRKSILMGGESGPALVPGKSAESLLIKAVLRSAADVSAMPPKENDKLAAAEIKALRAWIDAGAPWPAAEKIRKLQAAARAEGLRWKTSGGLSAEWNERVYAPADLWAYRPLVRPAAPAGAENPVDAFLNAAMKAEPAPRADRRTLLRRATYDLTGLPPTFDEVSAFLADPAPDALAFAKVVDRLLASPHYGEQFARHWLDLARYADSAGFSNDYDRGNAWRYRDYVVRSLNADKPYDRFVREQLAGDELDPGNPEMLVATGFLRMGAWELTGMEVAKIARQRYLDDVTDTVGQVFLGQMLQCARCHDHKFDPVPTRDYYRIQAAFATTQIAERAAPFLSGETPPDPAEKSYLAARKTHLEAELARIRAAEAAAREKWAQAHPERAGEKPPRHEFLSPRDLGLERIARKGLERLAWELDRFEPVAHSVYNGATPKVKAIYAPFRMPENELAGEIEVSRILTGGDPFSPGETVSPGVLSAAGEGEIPDSVAGRRRALAEWITRPDHPLTARVMANRVWHWTMGRPLAGNPNNLGSTGKKPTHPELLDWLAAEFVAQGYSIKKLQRLMLTSEAYARASRYSRPADPAQADSPEASYALFSPRRLAAEELRDSLLAASGELNRALGGIPVRPEINLAVAHEPRQVMGTFAPAWAPSPKPSDRHRRTLYVQRLRGLRDPFLEVFNAPAPDLSCEARENSLTAPQAFALLNGEQTRRRALALALLIAQRHEGPAAIEAVYRRLFQRSPTEAESKLCLEHWAAMTLRHRAIEIVSPPPSARIEREAIEENTGEKFRFEEPLFSANDFLPDAHPADASPEVRGLMEVALVLMNSNEFSYLD